MFEVYSKNKSVVCHSANTTRDLIFAITTDLEVAIDVHNWCDIAKNGESYTGREFIITKREA